MQEAAPAAAASADRAAADLNLDLSAARHVWLSKTTLALLLKSGQLVLTHLIMEAGNVKQMKVLVCTTCLVIGQVSATLASCKFPVVDCKYIIFSYEVRLKVSH